MFALSGITEKQDKVFNRFDELPEESKASYQRIFELVDGENSSTPATIKEVQTLLEANQVGIHANIRELAYGGALINDCLYSYDMTKMLLEHGADPNISDMMDGQTPMDHLAEQEEDCDSDNKEEVAQIEKTRALLLEHGAKRSALPQLIGGVPDDDKREGLWQSMLRGEDDNSLDGSDTAENED
jgi:hypothetical protein